jgi:hypothetical protein
MPCAKQQFGGGVFLTEKYFLENKKKHNLADWHGGHAFEMPASLYKHAIVTRLHLCYN